MDYNGPILISMRKNLYKIKRLVQKKLLKKDFKKCEFDSESGLYSMKINGVTIFSASSLSLIPLYKEIFTREVYAFKTNIKNPKIIDCGANIGLGILYWKKLFPDAEILAFEPSRKVFEALKLNVETNKLSNVKCINKALSNTDGTLRFTTNEDVSGSIVLEKNLDVNYLVDTTRLSPYINSPIDFLKIDIEGAEIQVLPEIENKLKWVQNIFIEYHSFTHQPQNLSLILSILEKHGFRYHIQVERFYHAPLLMEKVRLHQDLQINIWGEKSPALADTLLKGTSDFN